MTSTHSTADLLADSQSQRNVLTLKMVALQELAAADNDRIAACAAMLNRLFNDEALREALAIPILRNACDAVLGDIIRTQRAHVWNPPSAADARRRLSIAATINSVSLMNFQLPSGKRLGDATRAEVIEAMNFYLKQGRDMTMKGMWLRAVAQAMPEIGTKMVHEVLRVSQLKAMRAEAEKNVA